MVHYEALVLFYYPSHSHVIPYTYHIHHILTITYNNLPILRLRTEVEQQSKNNSQISQLERKYDTLLKNKEALEGQLADYNLAMDKVCV